MTLRPMEKFNFRKRLQNSFGKELHQIYGDLSKEVVEESRTKGLNQFHLRNRDCADFVSSDPSDRLIFASQSGLFPEEKI